MIAEALQHCEGIGPVRLTQLHAAGVRCWWDVLDHPLCIPAGWRGALVAESRRCDAALAAEDVRYFVDRLAPADRWRILGHFYDCTSFFDIETMGLHYDAPITVIVCWHRGQLHTFVEHENLDDFLDLLDDVNLLVSFNGSSFDVPRTLDAFHLPELPCAHLDLRWCCFHQGMIGGLKSIATKAGIQRPADLLEVDGQEAVRLWIAWREQTSEVARSELIRYCAADVLLMVLIAQQLIGRPEIEASSIWDHLPAMAAPPLAPRSIPHFLQVSGSLDKPARRNLRTRLMRSAG